MAGWHYGDLVAFEGQLAMHLTRCGAAAITQDVLLAPPESGLPALFQPYENAVVGASGHVAQLETQQMQMDNGDTVELVVLD